jgi:hypothetical protein
MADLGPDKEINLGETVVLTPVITGKTICSAINNTENAIKYLWSNGATTSSISVTPTSSGFYRVTVTDCNDCTDTESISIHVSQAKKFVIYPNPAVNRININSISEIGDDVKIKLLGVDGKSIYKEYLSWEKQSNFNISVSIPDYLTSGIYFIEIRTRDQVVIEKIILLHK